MKAHLSTPDSSSSRHDARIDAALQVFSHAKPAPGLEARVAARLSAAPRPGSRFHFGSAQTSWLVILQRVSVGGLTAAAASAIVVGTIQHSQRTMPPQALHRDKSGAFSTGNAVHVPTHAMPEGARIDPAAPRVAPHGRASVSRNQAHRATGTAVPRSPYPPDEPPAQQSNPQP